MKKLITVLMVLALASTASAATVGFQLRGHTAPEIPDVTPSEWIIIDLVTGDDAEGLFIDRVYDTGTPMGAGRNSEFNAGWDGFTYAQYTGSGNTLYEYVQALLAVPTSPEVTGILWSFEYHVPHQSAYIEIGSDRRADHEQLRAI